MIRLLTLVSFLFFSSQVLPQWEDRTNNLPEWNNFGMAMDAADSLTAVIAVIPQNPVNDTTLYLTKDGGLNWNGIFANSTITDVAMVGQNNIWFCTAEPNEIWSSANGGINWTKQVNLDSSTSFMNYIEMFDLNNGVAMGDAPGTSMPALFIKTTDGGTHWVSVSDSFPGVSSGDVWRRMDFLSSGTGYFIPCCSPLSWYGGLYSTIDNGQSWNQVPGNFELTSVIKFYDEINGILSRGNYIYRTIDSGQSWDSVQVSSNNNFIGTDIEFVKDDASKVWFSGRESLFFSSDSGKTWAADPLSGNFQMGSDLAATDGKVCWLLCERVYRNLNADHVTGIKSQYPSTPDQFILYQNFPNPFNPVTTIKYGVPSESGGGLIKVKLSVYDILGNKLKVLVNDEQGSGLYEVKFDGSGLASGIYLYRIQAGQYSDTKKLVILK